MPETLVPITLAFLLSELDGLNVLTAVARVSGSLSNCTRYHDITKCVPFVFKM